jgi:hypothetical protein
MDHSNSKSASDVEHAATLGMFAMMAMMLVCCVGMMFLFFLIPVLGWPVGLALVVAGGAALMYGHHRLMCGRGH